MKGRQSGISLMGFIIVLVLVAFFALIIMKLFPMYSEYYNLRGVMNELASEPASRNMTPNQVYESLQRRFNIAYIESVKKEHVKLIRGKSGNNLNIAYEVRVPMIFNLDVVGKFDYTVTLGNAESGG